MEIPKEIKLKYLERRIKDLEMLHASLAEDNFHPAEKVGHQIKGNAQTFGVPAIAPLGKLMEEAAMNEDKTTLKDLLELVSREITLARQRIA